MAPLIPILQNNQGGGVLVAGHPPAATADYWVDIAWAPIVDNAWRLDISPLDGTDVLTDTFSVDFNGPHDDLVNEPGHGVKSVRIRRGRDDRLASMQASECTIVLHDPDGLYNPRNENSPLYGSLLPMRQVQVRGSNDGGDTIHHLFRGFIRSIEHNPHISAQETTIVAVDLFVWLNRVSPTISIPGAVTTGQAIGAILDHLGWTDINLRAIDDGDTFDGFEADGTTTALGLIDGLLEAERGSFYVAKDGTATYQDRHSRATRTPVAAIDDTMQALRAGVDLDSIGNRARVARQIGTVQGEWQERADGDSIATYGLSDIGDITSPYLASDIHAAALAGYLVAVRGTPESPMWGLDLINRDAETLSLMLETELGDLVSVSDSRGGTSGDYFVEAVEHEITDGGKIHRGRLVMSERGMTVFVVGKSAVGGPDIITY